MSGLRLVNALVILCSVAAAASSEDLSELFKTSKQPTIRMGAFLWGATLKGEVGFPTDFAGSGNELDFRDNLDYKPAVNVPLARIGIQLARDWRLLFEYWQAGQESRIQLDRAVRFGDTTFNAGERVEASLRARAAEGIVGYRIFSKENLDLYLLGGINVAWFDQELRTPAQSSEFSLMQTSPLLGLGGEYSFSSRISVSTKTVGYFRRGLDLDEYLLDSDSVLGLRLFGTARIVLGYKAFWLSAKDDVTTFNFELAGPYAGFTWAF